MSFTAQFLTEAKAIIDGLDHAKIEKLVDIVVDTREKGGRLFMLGVGGSAGNASHAVNDFRKLAGIESYAPTDNVSELTARTNDEGWETIFAAWLKTSKLNAKDALFVFSVGGGSIEKNVSPNLVNAIELARSVGARIIGIVGKPDGHAAKVGDAVVVIPQVNPAHITPHSEAFQAVVWHLVITHPRVKVNETKWEGITGKR